MTPARYSLYIRWSDADQCFIAWTPEFGNYSMTHGDTYEEAARNGREVMEMVIEEIESGNWVGPVPQPHKYGGGHSVTPPDYEGKPLPGDAVSNRIEEQRKKNLEHAAT